jgi:hypothetical protein
MTINDSAHDVPKFLKRKCGFKTYLYVGKRRRNADGDSLDL